MGSFVGCAPRIYSIGVDGIRNRAAHCPVSAMVVGNTVVLGGALPANVQPIFRGAPIARWIGQLVPPVRFVREPGAPRKPDVQWVRQPSTNNGLDLAMAG